MYKVMINDEIVEHDFKPGDRIYVNGRENDTGTVKEIQHNGLFVLIEWDEHCKERLGLRWMPSSIQLVKEDGPCTKSK
jgi:hypothetical protein